MSLRLRRGSNPIITVWVVHLVGVVRGCRGGLLGVSIAGVHQGRRLGVLARWVVAIALLCVGVLPVIVAAG